MTASTQHYVNIYITGSVNVMGLLYLQNTFSWGTLTFFQLVIIIFFAIWMCHHINIHCWCSINNIDPVYKKWINWKFIPALQRALTLLLPTPWESKQDRNRHMERSCPRRKLTWQVYLQPFQSSGRAALGMQPCDAATLTISITEICIERIGRAYDEWSICIVELPLQILRPVLAGR